MKSLLILFALGLALATVPACEDDPADPITGKFPRVFENLTSRWHVLNNIEAAYNHRRIHRYDELIDDDFTFFLSAGDVGGGLPASWDRNTELQANTNLFSADPPPSPLKRVLSIDLDIQYEDDEGKPHLTWVEVTSPGLETWYRATLNYVFSIEVEGDLTYITNPGSIVQFTVRNAGTEEAPKWRLVEMRDLGSAPFLASSSTLTQPTTLGKVKALYR